MITHYKNKANIGIAVGLILSFVPAVAIVTMPASISAMPASAILVTLTALGIVGRVVFIWGCVMYAKAKGREGWWGAFGLLSLIGLIVMICLKDHAVEGIDNLKRGFEPMMRDGSSPPPYRG